MTNQTKVVLAIVGGVLAVGIVATGIAIAAVTFLGSSAENKLEQVGNEIATESTPGATTCPAADGSSPKTVTFSSAPPMCIDVNKSYTATFETTEGNVVVDLDTKTTPNVTNNFVTLARYHYYDGTNIFRTDPSIDIIQGGSPHSQSASDKGPGYTIKDEGGRFTYKEGDLVMARTGRPNSSGAQFFFGTGPNVALLDSQGTYLKFGHTTAGLDVLKKIMGMHKPSGGSLGGAPAKTVTVNKVTIAEK